MKVVAIIPAAGLGTRMKSPSPKQFLSLEGVPIIVHTLRRFAQCERIQKIIVPMRKTDAALFEPVLAAERFSKILHITQGGAHRQDSVHNGFKDIERDTDVVVIHDAVRPFVSVEQIDTIIDQASQRGSAIFAVPCVDTVKQIERNLVVATLPREKIVLVQTPQAFRYAILKEGFEKAKMEHFYATDESCLVERLGYEVSVLRGSETNIKITKPADLPIAEIYLRAMHHDSIQCLS